MSRSLKKGPYTFPRLLKRVKELNEKGKKEVIKTLPTVQKEILESINTYIKENENE